MIERPTDAEIEIIETFSGQLKELVKSASTAGARVDDMIEALEERLVEYAHDAGVPIDRLIKGLEEHRESVWIGRIADEITRRFGSVHMRTEDRLNDEYLMRIVREISDRNPYGDA